MSRILILYGTSEGQTAKVTERLADTMIARGATVDVVDVRQLPAGFSLDDYDGVLIGSSVHAGAYQKRILRFVKEYRAELQRRNAAFFSVSLSAAFHNEEGLKKTLDEFYAETGWQPKTLASFGGALPYRRYNVIKRLLLRNVAKQIGAPTDTSRNHEFTDWEAVTQFAETFVASVAGPLAA